MIGEVMKPGLRWAFFSLLLLHGPSAGCLFFWRFGFGASREPIEIHFLCLKTT
jgi:hypothetical protein